MRPDTTSSFRRLGAVGVIIAGSLAISGCDPLPPSSDWEIRIAGEQMWVTMCDRVAGGSITGYVEQPDGTRWKEFWQASGDIDLSPGDMIEAGQDSHGVDQQEFDPRPLADAEVVLVYVNLNGAEVGNASFEVPPGYDGDGWLRAGGSVAAEPCGTTIEKR